jgi:gliding motility-associated-like protein
MKKKLTLSLLLTLLVSCFAFAQPPAFTLDVTATAQTCTGNGSLSFTVTGTALGATMSYTVYLLPNTTTPVTTTTSTTVTSLIAGNYSVTATQTLAGESNTATDTATINNNAVPLVYTLGATNVKCGQDGVITVNVSSGTAVSYEIISGPETAPVQTSNVFNGLPVGQYQVRVIDTCGDALVVTVQLTQILTNILIDDPVLDQGELPSCTTITVDHFYGTLSGYQIFFPLTAVYTVFPPGGGTPITVTQSIPFGNDLENHLYTDIPFYHDQQYSYNLVITDVCGNVYSKNNNIINQEFKFDFTYDTESCGNFYLTIEPHFYVGPFTVQFLSSPAGFVPSAFNAGHPTFDEIQVMYGSDSNPVPIGTYNVKVTDACGHSSTVELTIIDEANPTVLSSINALSCTGQIGITMSGGRNMVTVIMTGAPDEYPNPLPDDVSGYITGSNFLIGGLPLGLYTFEITDECGTVYTIESEIAPSQSDLVLIKTQRAGCDIGMGSVKLSTSQGNPIQSVQITTAPGTFDETLPFDVSANLVGGVFYMNSLPAGIYTFVTVDNCGSIRTEAITINGYSVTTNNVEVIPNCGSFDLNLHFTSNGNYVESFWLQKFNEDTGTWGHPLTGNAYNEGNLPSNSNSVFLNNNQLNINLAYTGQFRVIKAFHIFSNGSPANQRCIQVIDTFTFDGAPAIIAAYSFPCANDLSEVIIDAVGVGTLTYEITTKNGNPFVVDNGESNLFSGLEAATYNFRVTDICGSFVNIQFDIAVLEPIAITAEGFCDGQNSTLSVQDFSFLTYKWYKDGAPGTILSTTNTLTFPAFDSGADIGTYFVEITSSEIGSCINQTLEYEVVPTPSPNAGDNNIDSLCNDGTAIDLATYLSTPHDAGGTWEDTDITGALNGSMLTTGGLPSGTYSFNYSVASDCGVTDVATITLQLTDIPATPVIADVDPLCAGSDIQFSVTTVTGAAYQWTGPDNFTSSQQNPLIQDATEAASGTYTLVITVNDCASPSATVEVSVDSVAQAGEDVEADLCNDGTAVNLEDYLSDPHDNGGTWEDTSGTGALNGNMLTTNGLDADTYEFKYTVLNACNSSDTSVVTLHVKDIPQAPAVDEVAPVCEGSDVQLSATAVAGATYQWTGPDNFSSALQNPLIENAPVTAGGTYSLSVIVNDCASPAVTVNVEVNAQPQFTIEGNTALCVGQTSVLTLVAGNFDVDDATYTWYHNGELLEDVTDSTIEISETGIYKVVVDSNGCPADMEITATENNNAFELVTEAGCEDFTYMIAVTNAGDIPGATFSWTGPEGFNASTPEADITDLAEGDYIVTVTNAEGCSAQAIIPVDNTACEIPRGISPNNDEKNDTFDLSNLDVIEVKIFNRYGLKVFEAKNYTNEWHGQSEGGDLPTGTYYYVVTLSGGKEVTGWVYLQREIK